MIVQSRDLKLWSKSFETFYKNPSKDQLEGAVYFDEVFNENESIIIKDMAVIIRKDVQVEKIRIDKCGYLTVQDTNEKIKLSAMHIDVVDGGELQVNLLVFFVKTSF